MAIVFDDIIAVAGEVTKSVAEYGKEVTQIVGDGIEEQLVKQEKNLLKLLRIQETE